jgi:hypothetical protein
MLETQNKQFQLTKMICSCVLFGEKQLHKQIQIQISLFNLFFDELCFESRTVFVADVFAQRHKRPKLSSAFHPFRSLVIRTSVLHQ